MDPGLAMSPLLCVIVMEAICCQSRAALLWELLYAGDLFMIAETDEDLIKRLNEWTDNVENRGLRVTTQQQPFYTALYPGLPG